MGKKIYKDKKYKTKASEGKKQYGNPKRRRSGPLMTKIGEMTDMPRILA